MSRRVIGDNHVWISDLFEGFHVPTHIHHPFVGPYLLKLVAGTNDVAEVTEEYFLPRTEVADNVGDLIPGIEHTLCHTAETQVDTVIGAGADLDETLEALESSHHPIDTFVAGRQPWITRVASHSDFVLGCHRDNALKEVSNPRPVHFSGDRLIESRCGGIRFLQIPCAVLRTSPVRGVCFPCAGSPLHKGSI